MPGVMSPQGPDPDHAKILICGPADSQLARAGNGVMVGLHAESPEHVDAFHAAAMANGGADQGAPGPRPDYGEGYYLAYVRDPTGNKLAAFFKVGPAVFLPTVGV